MIILRGSSIQEFPAKTALTVIEHLKTKSNGFKKIIYRRYFQIKILYPLVIFDKSHFIQTSPNKSNWKFFVISMSRFFRDSIMLLSYIQQRNSSRNITSSVLWVPCIYQRDLKSRDGKTWDKLNWPVILLLTQITLPWLITSEVQAGKGKLSHKCHDRTQTTFFKGNVF